MPLPAASILAAATLEVLGGVAILVGFQVRIVSWILCVYLIPTSILFHNYWALPGGVAGYDGGSLQEHGRHGWAAISGNIRCGSVFDRRVPRFGSLKSLSNLVSTNSPLAVYRETAQSSGTTSVCPARITFTDCS
jgi:hypothetical protein